MCSMLSTLLQAESLVIIIKISVKRKILSTETILSACAGTHNHTHTHTDYAKLNLHSLET